MNNTFNMIAIAMLISAVVTLVHADSESESHTVSFNNLCTFGTPKFRVAPPSAGSPVFVQSNGVDWTSNGYLEGNAWLNRDEYPCGPNGENCANVIVNLDNNNLPSSVYMNISGDFYGSVQGDFYGSVEYQFTGGKNGNCNGITAACYTAYCPTAIHTPSDDIASIESTCNDKDVNLKITFCPTKN